MARQRLEAEKVKLTTPEFRVSFPSVFQARAVKPGDKAKFSVQMLFQVKETEASKAEGRKAVSIEPLKAAVRAVLTEKYGPDRAKWPAGIVLPFRDGAEPEKRDKDGYGDGIIFVKADSPNKPGIVHAHAGTDNRPAPLDVPSDFYGGCYARATINPYWWEYMGRQGVSFGLQNLQKIRDGEPFGGREKAENDFDAIEVPVTGAAGAGKLGVAAAAAVGSNIGV